MATAIDMRDWINLIDNPIPTFTKQSLLESVSSIGMKNYLSELYDSSIQEMIPAFQKLWEHLSNNQNLFEAEDPDEVLRLALEKFGSVDAVLAALTKKGPPNNKSATDSVPEETKESVTNSAKKWYKIATKKTAPVKDADEWIPKKLEDIERLTDSMDKSGKFKGLKTVLRKIVNYAKKHPILKVFVIALLVAVAALLHAGTPWALGGAVLYTGLALAIMSGDGFGKSWRRILSASIGVMIGFGVPQAITKLNMQVDSLPQQYSCPATVAPAVINAPTPPSAEALIHKEDSEWIKRLRDLMDPSGEGVGVPTIDTSSFDEAFKTARGSMGVGHAFVWKGNTFTTNITEDGLLYNFPPAAVNFIKGVK